MSQDTFALKHTVFYAKHWYRRFDQKGKRKTIWHDLQAVLEADGYTMWDYDNPVEHKGRYTSLLLNQCQRLKKRQFALSAFYAGIQPMSCWRFGYYTKGNNPFPRRGEVLPEYDIDEAVVHYCLSALFDLNRDEWDFEGAAPDPKVLPLRRGIKQKSIKEHFPIKESIAA
jgi:hypothetical protein